MSRRQSRLAPFRAALRFARRDAWSSKGRSALIMAMVAIPVAGLSSVALVGMSMVPSATETIAVELGQADARIRVVNIPDPSLVQSPTNPDWFQIDRDENGVPVLSDASALLANPETLLPGGAILRALRTTDVTLTSGSATLGMPAVEGEGWNAGFSPKYRTTDGRAPRTDDEIMVTAATLAHLGVNLDDTVTLSPVNRQVRVVGVLAAAAYPDTQPAAFGRLGAFTGDSTPTPGRDDFYLFGHSLDWAAVQQLNQSGAVALSRTVLQDPPPASTVSSQGPGQSQGLATTIVLLTAAGAAFAVLEVGLLAGAAFMVGTRKQQRMLATVASVGGHRRTLFQIVTASGLVLGLAGGISGVIVGTMVGSLYMKVTADGSAVQYWGYHLSLPVLLAIVAFAMLIGWIASLVPAVAASRMDVLAGLRGSLRPPTTPRRRRSVVGISVILVGVAATAAGALAGVSSSTTPRMITNTALAQTGIVLVLGGPVAVQLGLLLLVPRLLSGTSRVLARLGTGPRMAGRDIVRNPARSVPVVASIMSTVFLGTLLLGFFGSFDESNRATYDRWTAEGQIFVDLTSISAEGTQTVHPVGPEVSTLLVEELDATSARVLSGIPSPGEGSVALMPVPALRAEVKCDFSNGPNLAPCVHPIYLMYNGTQPHIWTGEVKDLALILDTDVSAEAQRTLAEGGAVSLYSEYAQDDGTLRIDWVPASAQPSSDSAMQSPVAARSVRVPVVVQKPEHNIHYGVFMLTPTAEALGLGPVPIQVLAELPEAPDDAIQSQLEASLRSITGGADLFARFESGPESSVDSSGWALVAVGVLISFAAAAVALGLARADGRRDDITLSSIGAGAGLRRTIAFWQAAILAGTGAFLGGIVGLLGPGMLGLVGLQPFAPPWPQVMILLVALPLVIALGSWLVTRRAKFNDLAQRTR